MQSRIYSLLFCCLASVIANASSAGAQVAPAGASTSADSVYAHAKQLVLAGNGAAGRVIVDSMVAASTPDTPEYSEALYWRAALAASAEDAERDYRRVVVEYPLSRHAGDALLQLGRLEVAHGDRKAALTHLQRFVLENPRNPEHDRASLLLVKTEFDQNDLPAACKFLGRALTEVPDSEVELRNQFTYYSPRCTDVDTTRTMKEVSSVKDSGSAKPAKSERAVTATPNTKDSGSAKPTKSEAPRKETVRKETERKDTVRAVPPKPKFTLQVAAYPARADADRLAKRLVGRGFEARVVGASKPFRVRIGHYATRGAATAAAKQLKAKKIDAFVTEIGTDDKQ